MLRICTTILRELSFLRDIREDSKLFKTRLTELQGKEITLLISHDAEASGGAPVVLYEYAKHLHDLGEEVVFLSGGGGGLIDMARAYGIQAYRMGYLYKHYIANLMSLKPSRIIVNTIASYNYMDECVRNNYNSTPIIWWLHEEYRVLRRYIDKLPRRIDDFVHICPVSARVKASLAELSPDIEAEIMHYGCMDEVKLHRAEYERSLRNDIHLGCCSILPDASDGDKCGKKYRITLIGRICPTKNQLELIEVYKSLADDIRAGLYMDFIYGSVDYIYYKKLSARIAEDREISEHIKLCGAVPRHEMYKLYFQSDLILCTSVDDSLPVVITEAMMYARPYITSSATGQASIIEHGIDGYVYDVADKAALADLITEFVREGYPYNVRLGARALYEKYFSLDALYKRVEGYYKHSNH